VTLFFTIFLTRLCFTAPYDPFKTFEYAGPLKAVYPLSPRRTVPEEIQRPDYSETGDDFILFFYFLNFDTNFLFIQNCRYSQV
jgi:hypothetical protein